MTAKEIPAWLETLRNVSPSLADRAEADVQRWMNITKNIDMKLNRISILSNRIHRLEDIYADICEEYGMWSYQAERCDKIIRKANDELASLYGC